MSEIYTLEIHTEDLERSIHFYQTVFGWSVERGQNATYFDDLAEGVRFNWVAGAADDEEIICLCVDDAASTLVRAAISGGEIVQPIAAVLGQVARVKDPDGNLLGVYEPA